MREFLWIILFFSVFNKLKGNANIDDHLDLFDSIFGTPDDEEVQRNKMHLCSCDTSKLEDQLNKTIEKMTNMEKTIQRLSELTIGMSVEEYTLTKCQEGWSYYSQTDSCFKIITDKLSWFDAKAKCESLAIGSNLAKVTNTQENEHIKGLFAGRVGIWIGLNDITQEGQFEWLDGTPFKPDVYAGWSNPSPGDALEDCVALWPGLNGYWNDASCTRFQFASVCKMQAKCQEGWSYYSQTDSCFNIITDKLSWLDAKTRCESLAPGSNLASVTTAQENEHIKGLFAGRVGIWIGLNDITQEGQFEWLDGTPFKPDVYAGWSNPSPGDALEDCVALWPGLNGYWNDASCTRFQFGSVCKMQAS